MGYTWVQNVGVGIEAKQLCELIAKQNKGQYVCEASMAALGRRSDRNIKVEQNNWNPFFSTSL